MSAERWLYTLRLRWKSLFRRRRADEELDEEIRDHLERRIAEKVAAGMTGREARRAALAGMEGIERLKEESRDMRKVNWILDMLHDVRYGLRMLRRNPTFTAIAILTLALGIGANTAIFSIVDAVLLRPLPFRDPDRLVVLYETEASPGTYPFAGQDYLDWREQNHTFEDMAVYSFQESFNVSASGEASRAAVVETQANYFSMLGVPAWRGRVFASGEDREGQNHVATLSYGFWQRHFGGENDAVGKTVDLNGAAYTIVGIMPSWFRIPAGADLWVPLDASPKGLGGRGSHHLRALGRMKSGVSTPEALADLRGIAGRLEKEFPESNDKVSAAIVPLREALIGGTRENLWVMFAAVGFVLLIACVNVANLLLVRAADRRREMATRAALGAGRGRLVRQLLTESVLLSICGAIPGVALAYFSVESLRSASTFPIPQPNPVGINTGVLLYSMAASIVVGLLFGMLPAFQISRRKLTEDLRASGKSAFTASRKGRFVRNALVAVEVALSLVLLAGAGLLIRTFASLRSVDIGVRAENVLTAQLDLPKNRYPKLQNRKEFLDRLVASLGTAPGIHVAAISTEIPLMGGNNSYVQVDGVTDPRLKNQLVEQNYVTPDYLKVLGIPLLQGRNLTAADLEESARVMSIIASVAEKDPEGARKIQAEVPVVINKAMADLFWPNQDPIGKVFRAGGDTMRERVVGVAGNTRQFGLRSKSYPEAYYPLNITLSYGRSTMTIETLSAGPPESAGGVIASAVHSQDAAIAVFNVRTIPQVVSDSMTFTNYQTFLLGALAGLALALAVIGTYGVMSYVVTSRRSEIGIRMALGAAPGDVLWMVLRQGLTITAVGLVIGLAGALALTRLLGDLLYGVKPSDPGTLAAVCGVMAIAALAACAIPALRATRVDPSIALRYE